MARVRVGGNFKQFIEQHEEMARAFEGKKGIRIRVFNEVAYFLHVEYGTSRMEARAMVRNSFKPAADMLNELWGYMPYPFSPDDLEVLFELVKDFLLEEIRSRTPVRTGDLKKGMEAEVEQY